MPPTLSLIANRLAASRASASRERVALAIVIILHLAALAIMFRYEDDVVPKVAFILAWAILNSFWLALLRRPVIARRAVARDLALLVLLSQLKHSVLFMTVNFVDLMIVDQDTLVPAHRHPGLWKQGRGRARAAAAADRLALVARSAPRAAIAWRRCPASSRWPADRADLHLPSRSRKRIHNGEYLSKFARSGVTAIAGLSYRAACSKSDAGRGREAQGAARRILAAGAQAAAHRDGVRRVELRHHAGARHESAGRTTAQHFTSFDGKNRAFVVEGAGGPSWFTEYNVLAGLSVRSYGRFADFVTRIAAGRVERGLPWALRKLRLQDLQLLLLSRGVPQRAQLPGNRRHREFPRLPSMLGANGVEPDSFFYDAARQAIARGARRQAAAVPVRLHAREPLPVGLSLSPRPDAATGAISATAPEVDEYLRRQTMSARDYAELRRAAQARVSRTSVS